MKNFLKSIVTGLYSETLELQSVLKKMEAEAVTLSELCTEGFLLRYALAAIKAGDVETARLSIEEIPEDKRKVILTDNVQKLFANLLEKGGIGPGKEIPRKFILVHANRAHRSWDKVDVDLYRHELIYRKGEKQWNLFMETVVPEGNEVDLGPLESAEEREMAIKDITEAAIVLRTKFFIR